MKINIKQALPYNKLDIIAGIIGIVVLFLLVNMWFIYLSDYALIPIGLVLGLIVYYGVKR